MVANDFYLLGLIVLLPLVTGIFNGLFGKRLPEIGNFKPVDLIATGSIGLAFILSLRSVHALYESGVDRFTYTAFQWIHAGELSVDFSLMLDPLSALMLLVVTGVGFLIHLYSTGYMSHDEGKWKYFSYLNLFVFAMLCLILGKNLIVTFVGWEGVGACSYLLIGFWYTDDQKAKAGQKAFIVNRVGDFAFLLGLFLLYWEAGTVDYIELHEMATSVSSAALLFSVATPAIILIFIGCTGKSAQIPLYTWLPDAMAGPTPVSALIHAATMVTSGIYLLARLNGIVTLSPQAMMFIAVIGALTAFGAATMALVQNDIKGVLAYSTVSQLGYMFIAIGVGSFVGAVFHLMTHAFFKALLFLGSGSVIHSCQGEQDIRKMGGLHKYMPVTSVTFLIACFAIAGFPFLAGFFSKDLILWSAFSNVHVFEIAGDAVNTRAIETLTTTVAAPIQSGGPIEPTTLSFWLYKIVFVLGLVTAGLTAFYMFRLYIKTFLGTFRGEKHVEEHLHESPPTMLIPLVVLGGLSIIGGFTGWPHFIPHWFEDNAAVYNFMLYLEHWLEPVFAVSNEYRIANQLGAHAYTAEMIATAGSVVVGLLGIGTAFWFYKYNPNLPRRFKQWFGAGHKLLERKYYVDEIYDFFFVQGAILVGKIDYLFDQYVVDGFVNFVGGLGEALGRILRNLQSGDVQRYATYIVIAILLCVIAIL